MRVLGFEIAAISRAAVWLSTQRGRRPRPYDPTLPHPTPVVFVHGLLGDRTNFHKLEDALEMRGIANVGYFEYPPRLDWPRLATLLGRAIEAVRQATGVRRVDVVGHSLGGLIARYLVDMERDAPVRRLVTLCAPYFGAPLPPNELAVFGSHDPIVPVPHPRYGPHAPHLQQGGRVVVVPDCGHWGVLVHERVLQEVARFLVSPDLALTHAGPLRLEQGADRLTA